MRFMKSAKRLFATSLVAFSSLWSSHASAGIPVIDVAALTEAIQQTVAWGQQYGQMTQQMVQQYNSITGVRNLGDVLNNPMLQQSVPGGAQIMTAYSSINRNGFSGLSTAAQALRSATAIYNCEGKAGLALQLCQASSVTNSHNQANYQTALDLMTQRTSQIQSLQSSINSTSDPKAIAELTARITSEVAQVNNDANRINLMRSLAETQDRQVRQQMREREMKSIMSPTSAADTFVFTPH